MNALTILPAGWRLSLQPGQTLLEAADAGGVRLPRSCRNGTCRECRCRLLAGEVVYGVQWPGLSVDERDEGWVLPCVAHAAGDVTLLQPHAQQRPAPPGQSEGSAG